MQLTYKRMDLSLYQLVYTLLAYSLSVFAGFFFFALISTPHGVPEAKDNDELKDTALLLAIAGLLFPGLSLFNVHLWALSTRRAT